MTSPLSFRPARPEDLDRLVDLHAAAFPDARGSEARARHLTRNAFGGLSDLWVALRGEIVLAHAFLFPFEAWFGGERVRVGGVASLGVAPEARGQGVASALLSHLHGVARDRGEAATILHPFRQGFYARLGYAPTSAFHRLDVVPASIPWRGPLSVRVASGQDRDAMRACWEATGVRRTGTLVRPESLWGAKWLDERRTWLVVEGASGVEAYVAWTLSQKESDGETTLRVEETAALNSESARAVWGVLAAQRDQVGRVLVDVEAGNPFDLALLDAGRVQWREGEPEHLRGERVSGPMLRIVDPAVALEARGWPNEGRIVVDSAGARLEIVSREGRARVTPTRVEADVDLASPLALGAIAYGAVSALQAARLGWLRVRDDRTLARAEALFALPAYFSPDAF